MKANNSAISNQVFAFLVTTAGLSVAVDWGILSEKIDLWLRLLVLLALGAATLKRRTNWPLLKSLTGLGTVFLLAIVVFRLLSQAVHLSDATLLRNLVEAAVVVFVLGDAQEWPEVGHGFRRFAVFYVLACLMMIVLSPLAHPPAMWKDGRFGGLYGNAVVHAINCVVLLPLALEQSKRGKGALLLAGSLIFLILLAKARTALGVTALIVFMHWVKPWAKPFAFGWGKLLTAAVVVAGAAVFSDDLFTLLSRGQSHRDLTSLTGRTKLWDAALSVAGREPLFGGGSEARIMKLWVRMAHRYWTTNGGAHNHFLSTAAMLGFPLAVTFLVTLVGSFLISLARIVRDSTSAFLSSQRRVFAGLSIAVLIVAIFEANLDYAYFPLGWAFWWTILNASTRDQGRPV